jgi:hypothetical protein
MPLTKQSASQSACPCSGLSSGEARNEFHRDEGKDRGPERAEAGAGTLSARERWARAMFSASLSALSKMPMILPDAFPNVGDLRTFVLLRLTIDA